MAKIFDFKAERERREIAEDRKKLDTWLDLFWGADDSVFVFTDDSVRIEHTLTALKED